MTARTDRTWPLPKSPWIMRMTWSELLFAHWPVAPREVGKWLPKGVELDTRDGQAWVGVVPFLMSDVAPRWVPAIPMLSRFPELNVRTYVTVDGKPGVWFFSLDATSRIAVRTAQVFFHLPYRDARMSVQGSGRTMIRYESLRVHRNQPVAEFVGSYSAVGEPSESQSGTLEHWLTARYCLYSADRKGNIYRGEIDHPPWQLSSANCLLKKNTMGQQWGFDFSAPPHLLMAQTIKVRAWKLSRCL